VITKRAHETLKDVIRDLIDAIDDEAYEAPGLGKTRRLGLVKDRRARINEGKIRLVEHFVSAIFPGPTADIIIVAKQCVFTNER
jgi:hypothetical protein